MKLLNSQQKVQLKALIQMEPGLRTVQLADKLDVELDAIEDALSTLLDAGAVVSHMVRAPNGHPAKAFTLVGVGLPSISEPAVALAPVVVPVVRRAAPGPAPKMTKVGIAMSYIEGNGGSATSSELHKLLGLKPTEYASSYLKDGVADGRLVKTGAVWTIGAGKPVDLPAAPVITPVAAPIVSATAPLERRSDWAVQPAEPSIKPIESLADVAAKPLVGRVSFAQWSDGVMHIARDGVVLVTLQPWEVRAMEDYQKNFARNTNQPGL